MAKKKTDYQAFKRKGITFLFAWDDVDPSILHIYARHMTTPLEALEVFFNATEKRYNKTQRRNEFKLREYELHWFWYNQEEKIVIIIMCAIERDDDLEDDDYEDYEE
ncbi:MAG: hypothetical protein K2Z81_15300 [Cyanobacteria bacterium]|nr:hypothetical protein [Cyanobacteriota bacterium]